MKKILIVVDMQNDFISGSHGTPEAETIVPYVKAKIEEYEKNGDTVVYTRDTHTPLYPDTREGKRLPVPHCIKETCGWQIEKSLNKDVMIIFDKPTFGSVALAEFVTDEMFTSVELCGLCTDICVISNAMLIKAYLPEADITVDAAACAGTTPENHKNALSAMKMCQIDITNE